MSDLETPGPDHDTVVRLITEAFPDTDIVTAMGATFFSLDPEKHWPNFATIVTTDEHDMGSPSNLTERPDVYRLNIGVSRETSIGWSGKPPTPTTLPSTGCSPTPSTPSSTGSRS